MKALVIDQIGHTEFREIETPQLGNNDVLLRVLHVGLCGSDLNTFRGANPLAALPRIPGHEIGGEILEIGPNVPTDFQPGKRGIVIPYSTCGTCMACRSDRPNACKNNQTLGVQKDGGMCDVISVPYDRLILNTTLPAPHLALVEPLSVGFHAVARGQVSKDETVVVMGGGMIGVGAILGAKARGARVIVAEVSDAKTDTLLALGVETVINPQTQDLNAEIMRLTDNLGPNLVIEAVGLPETFRAAVDLASFAGRVVYVGYAKSEVSYNTSLFNLKELDIRGSRNATRVDFETVISFLTGQEKLANTLISKIFPWTKADQAFTYWEANRNKTFKVMIDLQDA
ncbi:zinc-binding alcohol dehydrogenase family protein [Cognatishimia sp. WU-CL00825]|uniref:zinc-binding alcohol dehydrogenase family protein n=1 Tax=Cognatishimia sp. WU-CL00825 TaxID=3127658 RepID=UPI003105BBD5